MAEPRLRLAIVGAGIGGLMFSIALRRFCEDISVDIYESAEKLTEVGAGIGVWARGWELMVDLGLSDDLTSIAGKGAGNFKFRKADQAVGIDIENPARPYGLQTFHRAEFLRVLSDHIPTEHRIHYSKRLMSYTNSESGEVTMHFKDGSTATADLVVGCDGIRSPVRSTLYRQMAEEAERAGDKEAAAEALSHIIPKYSGTSAYRGLVPTEKLLRRYPGHPGAVDAVMRFGKNKHFVIYPVSCGQLVNVVVFVSRPELEGQVYSGSWMMPCTQQDLLHEVRLWEEETKALVECMDDISLWAINTVTGLPTFVGKRVAILGDAAHAMTPHQGSGAGQAFEDGYILAALLAQPSITPATLGSVLQIYDRIRRPFSQEVQRRSRYTGMLYEFNGDGCEAITEEESAAGVIPMEKLDEIALDIDSMMEWMAASSIINERKEAVAILEDELIGLDGSIVTTVA